MGPGRLKWLSIKERFWLAPRRWLFLPACRRKAPKSRSPMAHNQRPFRMAWSRPPSCSSRRPAIVNALAVAPEGPVAGPAEAVGQGGAILSPAGPDRPARSRLAGGLERQAAQDRADQFAQHLRHGLWRWLRLDDGQPGTGRRLPGGHERQGNQPPPDSAGPARARTAAAAMARSGTTASCGSWPTGRACCCGSIPRPGRRKRRSRSMPRPTSRAGTT